MVQFRELCSPIYEEGTNYAVMSLLSWDGRLLWQEAHKRMRVKRLPTILALHLKRFKYVEQYNRHIKVTKKIIKIWPSFNLSIKSHA